MSFLLQDLKSGLRILLKSPGTAILGLLVLAVGIGMNAAMFSIVNGIVLKGLPFDGAERLMHVDAARPEEGLERQRVTSHEFLDWRQQQSSFESLHAFRFNIFFLSGTGESLRLKGAQITPGAFQMLGVQPFLGRDFRDEDAAPGAPPVAIIGYGFWKQRLAADTEAIGRDVRINGRAVTVIGVMPESFQFPAAEEIWLPLSLDRAELRSEAADNLHVFGKLEEGVTPRAAHANLMVICHDLASRYPETDAHLSVLVEPYSRFMIGEEQITLAWACLAAVGFLLLIACANVANLLLARAADRTQEMALRLALGAHPSRIVSQVLSETLVLTALAAPLSLGLAQALIRLFNASVAGQGWPFWLDIRIETTTFLYLMLATLLSALIAGLAPALDSIRVNLSSILGDRTIGSRSKSRLSAGLVVVEVALSCALMVGAGLMVQAIVDITEHETAFTTDGVLTSRMVLLESLFPTETDRDQFWAQAGDRLRDLPGVASGFSDYLPGIDDASLYYYAADHTVYADKKEQPFTGQAVVSDGWFETLAVRPSRGRLFNRADVAQSEPVVVVSESFARRQWGDSDPLDHWIQIGAQQETTDPWRRVIGVVPDLLDPGSSDQKNAELFVPLAQSSLDYAVLVARSDLATAPLAAEIKQTLYDVAPDVPLHQTLTFAELIAEQTFLHRLVAALFSIMAAVGLMLAGIGLYGILAFFISKRTAEAGLRAALGARKLSLALWIAGHGLKHVVAGLGIGLAFAFGLAQVLAGKLSQVSATDPLIFVSVASILFIVGVASTILPAWRATRVDPSIALRQS